MINKKTIIIFCVAYILLMLGYSIIVFTGMGLGTHVESDQFSPLLMKILEALAAIFTFPATYLGRVLPEKLVFLNIYIVYFVYAVIVTTFIVKYRRKV